MASLRSNPLAMAHRDKAQRLLKPFSSAHPAFAALETLTEEIARLYEENQYFREELGLRDAAARDALKNHP